MPAQFVACPSTSRPFASCAPADFSRGGMRRDSSACPPKGPRARCRLFHACPASERQRQWLPRRAVAPAPQLPAITCQMLFETQRHLQFSIKRSIARPVIGIASSVLHGATAPIVHPPPWHVRPHWPLARVFSRCPILRRTTDEHIQVLYMGLGSRASKPVRFQTAEFCLLFTVPLLL